MTAHPSSISPLTQEAVKLIKEQLPDFVKGIKFIDLKKYLIKMECIEPLLENMNGQLFESRVKKQTDFLFATLERSYQEQKDLDAKAMEKYTNQEEVEEKLLKECQEIVDGYAKKASELERQLVDLAGVISKRQEKIEALQSEKQAADKKVDDYSRLISSNETQEGTLERTLKNVNSEINLKKQFLSQLEQCQQRFMADQHRLEKELENALPESQLDNEIAILCIIIKQKEGILNQPNLSLNKQRSQPIQENESLRIDIDNYNKWMSRHKEVQKKHRDLKLVKTGLHSTLARINQVRETLDEYRVKLESVQHEITHLLEMRAQLESSRLESEALSNQLGNALEIKIFELKPFEEQNQLLTWQLQDRKIGISQWKNFIEVTIPQTRVERKAGFKAIGPRRIAVAEYEQKKQDSNDALSLELRTQMVRNCLSSQGNDMLTEKLSQHDNKLHDGYLGLRQEIERNMYELFLEYMQDSTKLKPGLDASEFVAIGKIAALMGKYLQTQKEMAQREPQIRQGIEAVEANIQLKNAELNKMGISWREKKRRLDGALEEGSSAEKEWGEILSAEKMSSDTVLIAFCVAMPAVISSALMWFGVISLAAPAVFPLTVTVAVLSILTIIIFAGLEFLAKSWCEAVASDISDKQVEIDAVTCEIDTLEKYTISPIEQKISELKQEKLKKENELTELQTRLEQILDTAASIHPGNDSNHSNNADPSGTGGVPLYPVSLGSTAIQLREPLDVGEEKGLNLMAVRPSSQGLFKNSTHLYPVITACDDTSPTVAP